MGVCAVSSCRPLVALRIEKKLQKSTKGYIMKEGEGLLLAWVLEGGWRAWRDLNSRHSEPESDALSGLSYRRTFNKAHSNESGQIVQGDQLFLGTIWQADSSFSLC